MSATNAHSPNPPHRDQLERIAASATGKSHAREVVDMGAYPIRIAADGTWYHEGAPFTRIALAKLFASVLVRDADGGYSLRTPAERGRIEVEDAPFTAVELCCEFAGTPEQRLIFRTNLDEIVTAGPGRPIRVETDPAHGTPRPYLRVRDGLDALILRPVFYDLVDRAEEKVEDGRRVLAVLSDGIHFTLGEA